MEHEALKKIIIHTAQFAHFSLRVRNWKEVYGFLGGYIDESTHWVHITNAYPITHGTHYGVAFKKQHYILSAYLNLKLVEKDEFYVGWYHSHPGLDLFLSHTDVINHLAYQSVNPKAIAFVFDHTKLISMDTPISIFQLDNPQFGASSTYHDVEYHISGIKKDNEIEAIKELYYKIENDVIAKKIPPIEKQTRDEVEIWRKRIKTKRPVKQLYRKKKKQRGIKQGFPSFFDEKISG